MFRNTLVYFLKVPKVLALVILATPLFATVKEIAHFSELAAYVAPDTVVLLDIDDTLITPVQMLGNDSWFEYRLKKHQNEGAPFHQALEKTLAEWEAIRHLTRIRLVEPETSAILAEMQKKGIRMIGVTAQGLALATRTVLQLLEHQVDLSVTSFCSETYCFPVQGHTVLYRQGVLFTSGKPKGESFFLLCDQVGQLPKRIVAMDDKLSHLQSLEKEANERDVEFVGLRYGFTDRIKEAFSPDVADYQMNHSTLTHLLSDQEAIERINNSP